MISSPGLPNNACYPSAFVHLSVCLSIFLSVMIPLATPPDVFHAKSYVVDRGVGHGGLGELEEAESGRLYEVHVVSD